MHDSSQNDEIAQEVSCDSLDENMSINNVDQVDQRLLLLPAGKRSS